MLTEDEKRFYNRDLTRKGNYSLNIAAKNAGVKKYDKFHNAGYKGLYNGETANDMAKRKGLRYREEILDNMGSDELIANLFKISQTEQKLKKDKILGESNANNTHYEVGSKIRKTIEELGKIVNEAEKRVGHPIYVLCDEPYRQLAYDGKAVPYIPSIIKNSIYIYSYSKTLSIPGERIGYLAISKNADCYEELIGAFVVAKRCLGYVNAPSLFQLVISRCQDVTVDLDFYDRNRKVLYDSLTKLGFDVVKPEGAFYLLVKSPIEDCDKFVELAKEQHIIFVNTMTFGCPGYVRIAYCVDYEMIKGSINAFKQLAIKCGISS